MGGKTSGKRKLAPAAQPKPLLAEGAAHKRTPQSTFDVFSAAGKMHSDLKKSSKTETLEASLFAMHRCRTD